jgi:hypothetical protein
MISTRDLSALLDIDRLKTLSQSLAMLDAIISPEWEYRYYSFNNRWAPNEAMASMRDGSGDDYFALFNPAGAILKGFAHESAMSPYADDRHSVWPGVLDDVPTVFAEFLTEPAFTIEDTTFCIWRTYNDSAWQRGDIQFPGGEDPDGSGELLGILDGNPQTYQAWAEDYYGRSIDLNVIQHVYEQRPLTQAVVTALNTGLSLRALADDIEEIGYPGGIVPA